MAVARLRENLLVQGLAPRSADVYVRAVRRADAWCTTQGYTLDDVPPDVLSRYVATVPRTHASRKLLRAALAHYWRLSRRRRPPLWVIPVPRKPRMRCRALDPADANRLAAVARARRDREGLAVLLGLYLGLRREEIATLRWADFDAEGWVTIVGKGGVTATLPVHPVLVEHLEAHRARVDENGWLFPGQRRGAPVVPTTVWLWVRAVATDAGLAGVTPHRLRHTCLATANDATGDLRAVQEFARHARPETTAGYTRATASRLRQVMASLDYTERASA